MALKALNSISGFSVGEIPIIIVDANGNIAANNLSVSGKSNVGPIANLIITGGTAGQVIQTDGLGNLTFTTLSTIQNGDSNVIVQANSNVTISANGTADVATFTKTGANIQGYLDVNGNIKISNATATNGILTDNLYYANGVAWDLGGSPAGSSTQLQFNNGAGDFGASSNLTFDTTTNILAVTGQVSVSGNINISNATPGWGIKTDNLYYSNGTAWDLQQAAGTGTQIQYNDGSNNFGASANFTYSDATQVLTVTGNANVTNTINTANVNTPNINSGTSNLTLTSNGNSITFYAANGDVSFPANVSGNFTGSFAAPGSNTYIIFNDDGVSNAVANFTYDKAYNSNGGQLNVGNTNGGEILTDNVYAAYANILDANVDGNLTVNLDLSGNTANFTGDISAANVTTPNVFGAALKLNATTGNLTLVVDSGNIAVNNVPINNLANPSLAQDAATKAYVDQQVAAGIDIHASVNADSDVGNNLNATYVDGGTTPTWTDITGTDTIVTGSAHGLSVNDVIVFGSSINGITAGTPYFVAATPTSTSIKITTTWDGSPITTLTAGTGLTITSLANSGDGATLTSNINGTLTLEGYTCQLNDRVLILGQTNQTENGVYVVTDPGAADPGGSPWELTRASDGNKYGLNSPNLLSTGAYFLVTGGTDKGESYVLNTVGTIVFGTTNITFAEFSIITPYTAGTGLGLYPNSQFYITNTTVSSGNYGNGDRVASFTVNSQGQLTAASDTVIAANAANLTGTSLASTINSSNLTSLGTLTSLEVNGNANISANLTTNNLTVNLQLAGNTANFTGNVTTPILNVGNTAVKWGTLTTTTTTANQTVASLSTTGVTGVEFLVKGVDSTGAKRSIATVQAVTDGTDVDYSIYGVVNLGESSTGILAVNISGGNIALQVTPSSTNSTVWTTQVRTI